MVGPLGASLAAARALVADVDRLEGIYRATARDSWGC